MTGIGQAKVRNRTGDNQGLACFDLFLRLGRVGSLLILAVPPNSLFYPCFSAGWKVAMNELCGKMEACLPTSLKTGLNPFVATARAHVRFVEEVSGKEKGEDG